LGKRRKRGGRALRFVPELRGPIDETDPLSDQCQAITSTGARCSRSTVIVLGGHSLCAQHAAMDRVRLVQRRSRDVPGSLVRSRRVNPATKVEATSPYRLPPMIRCPWCSAVFSGETQLLSHTVARHKKRLPQESSMRKLVPCPACAVPVRRDRLERHIAHVHPAAKAVQ